MTRQQVGSYWMLILREEEKTVGKYSEFMEFSCAGKRLCLLMRSLMFSWTMQYICVVLSLLYFLPKANGMSTEWKTADHRSIQIFSQYLGTYLFSFNYYDLLPLFLLHDCLSHRYVNVWLFTLGYQIEKPLVPKWAFYWLQDRGCYCDLKYFAVRSMIKRVFSEVKAKGT